MLINLIFILINDGLNFNILFYVLYIYYIKDMYNKMIYFNYFIFFLQFFSLKISSKWLLSYELSVN